MQGKLVIVSNDSEKDKDYYKSEKGILISILLHVKIQIKELE